MRSDVFPAAFPDGVRPAEGGNVQRAGWGLALLIVLALYTSMDRQVLGLLSGPLRRDLGLSDMQFGLLQGTSVALFTALAGYPLAWIADHTDRRRVLVISMGVWCLALIGCAFASGFAELFAICSLMGAAEAGVIPIAYALIADWFGLRHRQVATSLFVMLGRLGAGVMIAVSGWLVASVDHVRFSLPLAWRDMADWRLALAVTALPGLMLLPLLLTMPIARRTSTRPAAWEPGIGPPPVEQPAAPVAALVLLLLGATLLAGGAAAANVFMPVLVQRLGGLGPAQAGAGLGAAALAAALVALAASAGIAWRQPERAAGNTGLRVAALGMTVAAVSGAMLALVTSHLQALLLYAGALAGTMTAAMLLVGILQGNAPHRARTRFMAVFVGAAAVGAALSPVAVGAWSEAGGATSSALAIAMAGLSAPCFAGAALTLALAARRIQAV